MVRMSRLSCQRIIRFSFVTFSNLAPEELWGPSLLSSVKEIYIYGLYKGGGLANCWRWLSHDRRHGNPMTGLKQYAVVGDGRSLLETEADALIQELEKRLKRFTEKSKKEWRRN